MSILAEMDFDQLTSDLGALTKMAEASRERLGELAGRAAELRQKLQQILDDVEPPQKAEPSSPEL